MRNFLMFGLVLTLSCLNVSAQTPTTAPATAQNPAAEAEALKNELELLKQRLNALEIQNAAAAKAAADAQAAAVAAQAAAATAIQDVEAATAPPAPVIIVDSWRVAENWQKILRGSDESVVQGLLGRPESITLGAAGNTWVYQDREQPALGRGTVRFMKGRGAVDWEAPKFPAP